MTQRQSLIEEFKQSVGNHTFFVKFESGDITGRFNDTFLLPSMDEELEVKGYIFIKELVEDRTHDYPGSYEFEFRSPTFEVEEIDGHTLNQRDKKYIFSEVNFEKY